MSLGKSYDRQVSNFYDDRDGDTLTSLAMPIIKVCSPETPPMIFFIVPSMVTSDVPGVPQINLEITHYAHMPSLSKELQEKVREELKSKLEAWKAAHPSDLNPAARPQEVTK